MPGSGSSSRLIQHRPQKTLVTLLRKRDILPARCRDEIARLIQHLATGLHKARPRRFNHSPNHQRLIHLRRLAKPNRHLTANAKPPPIPRCRPHHRLIKHRGQNSAMNNPLKSNVLRARREVRLDDTAGFINMQMQVQTLRILPPADEAPGGVGQLNK